MDWLTLIFIYLFFHLLFSYALYRAQKKYYAPKVVTIQNKEGKNEIINMHDKYDEFARRDSISFFRIFIGSCLFTIPKLVACILCAIYCILLLK